MNARSGRIVVTGFMAAGKTTVARALAARLGCASADTDELITAREGRSIRAIIDEDGEARFRQIETSTLRAVLDDNAARIIALGGGAWTLAENRSLIARYDCLTVWLDAPFELCWQRIADADDARPLARDRTRARELYEARRASYELASHRVAVGEELSADDVAAEIVVIIERQSLEEKRT